MEDGVLEGWTDQEVKKKRFSQFTSDTEDTAPRTGTLKRLMNGGKEKKTMLSSKE